MAVVSDSSTITGVSTVSNSPDLVSVQVFTTVGTSTWTKPSGINRVRVIVTGAGAGGGGPNDDDAGGGGGAGATAIKMIDVTSVSSVTVTVGGGSDGAGNNSFPNIAGGTSSFGAYCSAAGGNMTAVWGRGGLGGTATGGDINITGGDAYTGNIDGLNASEAGGTGGASYWGGGGTGGTAWGARNPGRCYGAGGGGAHFSTGYTAANGKGADGIVVVEEYR